MKNKSRHRIWRVITGVVLLGGLGIFIQRWYYLNFTWPRDIQTTLFRQEVTSHDDLIYREGFLLA